MEINDLRLTDEEWDTISLSVWAESKRKQEPTTAWIQQTLSERLVDAQLAKALWGFIAMFEHYGFYGNRPTLRHIREQAEAAGIPRPQEAWQEEDANR